MYEVVTLFAHLIDFLHKLADPITHCVVVPKTKLRKVFSALDPLRKSHVVHKQATRQWTILTDEKFEICCDMRFEIGQEHCDVAECGLQIG